MKEIKIEQRSQVLIDQLVNIWEKSVRKTHLFLSKKEIEKIKQYVPQALRKVSHLIIETDEKENPIAFMGIESQKLEMLFITPEERGKGLGKKLIEYGTENYKVNILTVNEQNLLAKEFYEHMGFRAYKRTKPDEQGKLHPILYMRLEQ